MILKFYREPALIPPHCKDKLQQLQREFHEAQLVSMETELCFYVDISTDALELTPDQLSRLRWILSISFQEEQLSRDSFLSKHSREKNIIVEIGPRFNFSTPFSTNAVAICQSIGLQQVKRIECSIRYLIYTDHPSSHIPKHLEDKIADRLHDRMTEMRYDKPIDSFHFKIEPEPWYEVDILGQGRAALEKVSQQLGLAFDDWDLNFYTEMFQHRLKRNPTSVECFDLAQSNSEHSRHWFFKGKLVVDGLSQDHTLFDMVIETQRYTNQNNVIKFSDNSSGIEGFEGFVLKPSATNKCSKFIKCTEKRDIIFTAETHNFPTGVAPFPGATTGTGGRIRDVQAAGRGGHVIAGTAGYCFGNLQIPEYRLPWETESFIYPNNLARPVKVAIEASNGASDYGNKFGEPVIAGFARSFGMRLPNGERKEYVKPIMFSGGIGTVNHDQIRKEKPEPGMEVVKVGGPVFRIGVGGGAASSVNVHGDNKEELDYGAVQRGDAEMEQKLNRVIRGCLEMGDDNPIASIHDQGAGGNGNVLKEICEPAGAIVYTENFQLGDPTISTLECWGAEYQESNAILVRPEKKEILKEICKREKCPVSFVGEITGDGNMVLVEGNRVNSKMISRRSSSHPVNLDLDCVLGKMPQKTFYLDRVEPLTVKDGALGSNVSIAMCLDRVLRLPAVASKRYLTNKVDRSVTGLIAQQQCVGPIATPLADVAVVAHSYFEKVGSATAIGEQPIKGLISPGVGARMSVVEALTNLMFANISCLEDVKCSANWMWPAKLPGEGAALFDACKAMSDIMAELGVAVDGGKDSLSMAARVGEETVKSPGTLVISAYAPCVDITKTVTPDLKCEGRKNTLLYVKMERGRYRLGGTSFAQVFNHFGEDSPDLEHSKIFKESFKLTQKFISERKIRAGHDVSDGGVLPTLLEMAFAGNCGLDVNFKTRENVNRVRTLFNEEVGWILEVAEDDATTIINQYEYMGAQCDFIGLSGPVTCDANIRICINSELIFNEKMSILRDIWEETSFKLDLLQSTQFCVIDEQDSLQIRKNPPYKLSFDPDESLRIVKKSVAPKVCVLREEGTNGDREMSAALFMVGFEVWDVHMSDLMNRSVDLNDFQGLVFPGGFSYADVLGAAKGWAAQLMFDKELYAQLETFKNRPDTFSLGVCNGCQLMAILGLVAPSERIRSSSYFSGAQNGKIHQGVTLAPNISGRYESRFSTVKIEKSPAIMFDGMEGSVLGVWISHGEGRFEFKNSKTYEGIRSRRLVPLSYVDDKGSATTSYPFNPNGSPGGLAGLCSEDGRHLAIMPHPERTFMPWQWAWMPNNMRNKVKTSPWLRMFENAYEWCIEHR